MERGQAAMAAASGSNTGQEGEAGAITPANFLNQTIE